MMRLVTFALAVLACVAAATAHCELPPPDQICELLVGGTWARHLDDKVFHGDGTFVSYERGPNRPIEGHWRLTGWSLSLTAEHETTTHRILAITPTMLQMTFGSAGQRLHYTRSASTSRDFATTARRQVSR